MKKLISLISGVALCTCFASTGLAADYDFDATEGTVEIDVSNTNATSNLVFSPSTSVVIEGASNDISFAHSAYHTAVDNGTSGKQFGMASDASAIYFLDISPDGNAGSVDTTGDSTKADLLGSGGTWHTL